MSKRGAFIVVEGLDGSGKTTLVRELAHALQNESRPAIQWHFPNRRTETGKLISRYLKQEIEMDAKAMHHVFVANFHEDMEALRSKLEEGVTVFCDRYVYSGIAYTSAVTDEDISKWNASITGLIVPDVVLYLNVPEETAISRLRRRSNDTERYERRDLQNRVRANFETLHTSLWHDLDAAAKLINVVTHAVEISYTTMEGIEDRTIDVF